MPPQLDTLFIGRQHLHLDSVDSTNTFAMQLLQSGQACDGMVITAAEQTAGRGQRGNVWHSVSGENMLLSLVLKPSFLPINGQFDLTRAIALGISDAIAHLLTASSISIKWPNDIMVNTKKIGGILIESQVVGKQLASAVVGLGLNVNQVLFDDSLPNAISLKIIAGKSFDMELIFYELCRHIEQRYLQLRAGKNQELQNAYRDRLFQRNVPSRFQHNGIEFIATIIDTTSEGLLVVQHSDMLRKQYNFQELFWLGSL